MYLRETGIEFVNWIQMAEDRIQCRALANTVMNLRAPQKQGIPSPAE